MENATRMMNFLKKAVRLDEELYYFFVHVEAAWHQSNRLENAFKIRLNSFSFHLFSGLVCFALFFFPLFFFFLREGGCRNDP